MGMRSIFWGEVRYRFSHTITKLSVIYVLLTISKIQYLLAGEKIERYNNL